MPGNLGKSQIPCALEDSMQNAGNTEKYIFLCVLTDCEELAAWSALHWEQMRELHIYWHMTWEGKRTLGTDTILTFPLALIRVLLLSLRILVVLSCFCCCSIFPQSTRAHTYFITSLDNGVELSLHLVPNELLLLWSVKLLLLCYLCWQ